MTTTLDTIIAGIGPVLRDELAARDAKIAGLMLRVLMLEQRLEDALPPPPAALDDDDEAFVQGEAR